MGGELGGGDGPGAGTRCTAFWGATEFHTGWEMEVCLEEVVLRAVAGLFAQVGVEAG